MLLDAIRAELARLQVHAVNLGAELKDNRLVALRGSLLRYWDLPACLDGQRLLAQLQALPDKAGPEAVMNGLVTAFADECTVTQGSQLKTQLQLFDPQSQALATTQTAVKKEH